MKDKGGIYVQLGRRVREIRLQLGLTQEKLAVRARLSPTFLSHIERGVKKASLESVERLATALDVPISNLFYPPKKPIAYIKNEEEIFTRRLEGLLRDKDDKFKKMLWDFAGYLTKKQK